MRVAALDVASGEGHAGPVRTMAVGVELPRGRGAVDDAREVSGQQVAEIEDALGGEPAELGGGGLGVDRLAAELELGVALDVRIALARGHRVAGDDDQVVLGLDVLLAPRRRAPK